MIKTARQKTARPKQSTTNMVEKERRTMYYGPIKNAAMLLKDLKKAQEDVEQLLRKLCEEKNDLANTVIGLTEIPDCELAIDTVLTACLHEQKDDEGRVSLKIACDGTPEITKKVNGGYLTAFTSSSDFGTGQAGVTYTPDDSDSVYDLVLAEVKRGELATIHNLQEDNKSIDLYVWSDPWHEDYTHCFNISDDEIKKVEDDING